MKSLREVFILILIFTVGEVFSQTIHIANNNPGANTGTNVYTGTTALQDAVAAAVSGDIIHVIPGPTNYGNIVIDDKSLTIVGIGLNPQIDIGSRSLVDDINIENSGASGTRVSGLHFDRLVIANDNTTPHTVSNVLLENSHLDVVIAPGNASNTVSNLIIRNCIFNSANGTGTAQAILLTTTSGVIISNNIIKGRCCVHGSVQGQGLTIQNNLFYDGSNGIAFHDIDNSVVQNNIFLNCTPGIGTNSTGNSFQNNISYLTSNDAFTIGVDGNTGSGNMEATDPMLTNVQETTGNWNFSYDITPMVGSPVLNAGTDGTDIGPTGGANPFDTEGTYLPLIESLNIPAVVSQGTNLQVNVKAKGN